jgi:hypothetical protein
MSDATHLSRELDGLHCSFAIRKYSGGTVVMKISGVDIGEFGERPMRELMEFLRGPDRVRLFIDARDVRGASMTVGSAWATWLRSHKILFEDISMLAGTRYVQITADCVRRFAALESTMRIYTEPAVFDALLAQSLS